MDRAKADLRSRLQARRNEIEQAALTRVFAIADPSETSDPEYVEGLRRAVSAALSYGFAATERGEARAPEIPVALLAQARMAARSGVGLDTVLRRYCAGYALLGDFLIGEAEEDDLFTGAALKRLLRTQATLLDHLLTVVSEEYNREARNNLSSSQQRRSDRVERLLDGELLDTSDLGYDLDSHHLGVVAVGSEAAEAIHVIATGMDCRLLMVHRGEVIWAWLGTRSQIDWIELNSWLTAARLQHPNVSLAFGEPGEGPSAWRLSHRQAKAALLVSQRAQSGTHVRYADVALLTAILQDDLLAASLRKIYLDPLEEERDGGVSARDTLRAYFAAERNVSSSAAALGVKRHTVTRRLRAIESRIGRDLGICIADLETALRLAELDSSVPGTA